MPCWFFERKDIRNSPSFKDGTDQQTENRYRREGARLILDAGTKLGLYDTCATGVVYFHRFYMFHGFSEFNRFVMGACCLFLAGKVEETPKKCKDIIKTVQGLLPPDTFLCFGEDPKEEVMTMERILLQTIKFELQVEHPHSFLLSFAKQIKGDKDKIQKMAQMAWTFINDSLCTTLCLQWESEIIAVSLMYLASRLTKFDPTDWTGRVPGSKSKWWEDIIEGMSMELMEDICHQVLDLYSAQQQAQKQDGKAVSPPAGSKAARLQSHRDTPPPPPKEPPPPSKRSRSQDGPAEPQAAASKAKKVKREREDVSAKQSTSAPDSASSSKNTSPDTKPIPVTGTGARVSASSASAYVSSYSSSFMSQEGQQSIQSLLGGVTTPTTAPPQPYSSYQPPTTPSQYPPSGGPFTPGGYSSGNTGYPPAAGQFNTPPPYTGSYSAPSYSQAPPSSYTSAPPNPAAPSSSYQPPPAPYSAPPPSMPPPGQGYPYSGPPGYPPPMNQPPPAGPPPPFPPPGFGGPPPGPYNAPPPPMMPQRGRGGRSNHNNLTPVRHVSERGGRR